MDYLEGLNRPQYDAVTTVQGPLMVLAGAGAGKTRVLTMRIAHLIHEGVDPFNILALTFTNKAALEMNHRIAKVVGQSHAKSIWMGTFHSVFARILRNEAHYLGFSSNFTIYDSQDSVNVLKKIIKEMNLDSDLYKPKKIQDRISRYKNNLITVRAYFANEELVEMDKRMNMGALGKIYQKYVEVCQKNGAMDFDDLLLKTNELLTCFPEVLAKYQDRFRYILVDEYQDTNHSQYMIVRALASKFENICVVGDDAQSIYSFRGANIRNILNFKQDYPDAKTIALEQNYRSTQNIVNAANSAIANNRNQFKKNVFSENEIGEKVKIYRSLSDAEEANFVVNNIWEQYHFNQKTFDDFAILYRTNSQTRAFEDALRKKNIPYKVYGGLSFYQRKEIKDLLAYFRVLVNEQDTEALMRIINYPVRGIGETTQNKIVVFADEQGKSVFEVLDNLVFYSSGLGLNQLALKKIDDFWQKMKALKVMMKTENAYQIAMEVAKQSGILKQLKEDATPEGVSRLENVQELLNSIQGFIDEQQQIDGGDESLSYFLETAALASDIQKEETNEAKVSLMTIHLSKGLEFPIVYIVGLEENLFPSMMSSSSREDLEEERRLFYVALTRAEKQVYFTYATTRFQWGKISVTEPSRFLSEIDAQYIEFLNPEILEKRVNHSGLKSSLFEARTRETSRLEPRKFKKKATPSFDKKLVSLEQAQVHHPDSGVNQEIKVGDVVRHNRFGVGEVLFLDGSDPQNIKAKVVFKNEGEKNLILKFAKLEKL